MSTTKSPVRTSSVPLQTTTSRDEVDKELWGWFQDFIYEVKKVKRVTKTNSQKSLSRHGGDGAPSSSFETRRRSSRRQSIVNVISTPTSGVNSGVVSRTATEVSSRQPFSEMGDILQSPSPPFHARRETLPGSDGMTTTTTAANLPGRRALGAGSQPSTTTTPTSSQGLPHYVQSPVTNESLASNPGWFAGSLESKRESSAAAWSGTAFSALTGADDLAGSTGLMIPQRTPMGGPVTTPTGTRTDFNPDPSILTSKSNPSYSPMSGARHPSLSTGSSQPVVWKGIEGTPEDSTEVVNSQQPSPPQQQQPPISSRSRHSSGGVAAAQSGESTESRTYRVNSQSFSMRVAVQKQSRLSSAIRSMDRTDLENHMEKAVRLLFQLIKERKVHCNSPMGTGHNANRRSSGAANRRQSMPSNVLGGSIFQSAGHQSENTPRRAGGEKRSSEGEQRRSTDTIQSGGKIHRRNNSGSKQASLAASDVFKTSNTDFDEVDDDDNTQSSSSYSDGYDNHNPHNDEAVTRKRSKKLIREKRRLEPQVHQERLTQYHAFQDSKRVSDATSITGIAIGSPLDITGVAWDVTIRTGANADGDDENEDDPHQFATFLKTDTSKDRKSSDNASHHHHHHHHHHRQNSDVHDNFYPPGLVITDSMDIDDLMGSRSLMDMSDFVQHTELEKEMDKEGNRIMNGYVFSGSLGKGAYGKVRLAYERENPEKKVAIKIINKSLTKNIGLQKRSQQAHALVQKEIAIMKKLRHKNIVTLHAVVDDPDAEKLYLIMEYIGGGHILQEETEVDKLTEGVVYKAIPEPTVVKYLRQLVDGIRYLHKHKIAHRDIKPTNLLLGDEGRLYIADFGVSELGEVANVNELNISYSAAVEDSKRRDVTPPSSPMASVLLKGSQSTHMSAFLDVGSPPGGGGASSSDSTTMVVRGQKGTPMFWPPEMFRATEQEYFVDGESQDLWALGVTTYMMLTGKSPFKSTRFIDLKNEIISDTEVEIPDFLSANAQLLLRSMLNKDPSKRLTLLEVRHHEFMGGYDKRTAAARGSFCVTPADAQEEAAAISVASNAIPMMKFFLFRAKPFFRGFIARIREKIRLRNVAKEELGELSNTVHSDMVKSLVESNSLNSTLSNTQAGRHHTLHDSSHNPSEVGGNSTHLLGVHQQHDLLHASGEGFHPVVTRVPDGRSSAGTLLDVPQEVNNPPVRQQSPAVLQQQHGQITPQPPNAPIDRETPRHGMLGPSLLATSQSKESSSSEAVIINPSNTTTNAPSPMVPTIVSPSSPIRPLHLASLPNSPNATKPPLITTQQPQQQQQAGSPLIFPSSKSSSPMAAVPKPQTPSSHANHHPVIHHYNHDDGERPSSVYTKTLQPGARPASGVYSIASLRRQGSAWWGGNSRTTAPRTTSSERPGVLPSPAAGHQRVIPPLKGFSSVSLRSKPHHTINRDTSPMAHTSSFNSVNEDPPVRSVSLPSIPVNNPSSPPTPRRRTDILHGTVSEERTVSKTKSKLLDAISDGSP